MHHTRTCTHKCGARDMHTLIPDLTILQFKWKLRWQSTPTYLVKHVWFETVVAILKITTPLAYRRPVKNVFHSFIDLCDNESFNISLGSAKLRLIHSQYSTQGTL